MIVRNASRRARAACSPPAARRRGTSARAPSRGRRAPGRLVPSRRNDGHIREPELHEVVPGRVRDGGDRNVAIRRRRPRSTRRPSDASGLENSSSQTSTASWWTSVIVGGNRRLQSGVRNGSVLMLSTTTSKPRRRMSSRWTSAWYEPVRSRPRRRTRTPSSSRGRGCAREARGEQRHLVALRDPLLRHLVGERPPRRPLPGSRRPAS